MKHAGESGVESSFFLVWRWKLLAIKQQLQVTYFDQERPVGNPVIANNEL